MTTAPDIDDELVEIITIAGDDFDELVDTHGDDPEAIVVHLAGYDSGSERDADAQAGGETSPLDDWVSCRTCRISIIRHGGLEYLLAFDEQTHQATLLRHELVDHLGIALVNHPRRDDLHARVIVENVIVYDHRLRPAKRQRFLMSLQRTEGSKLVAAAPLLSVEWDGRLGYRVNSLGGDHRVLESGYLQQNYRSLARALPTAAQTADFVDRDVDGWEMFLAKMLNPVIIRINRESSVLADLQGITHPQRDVMGQGLKLGDIVLTHDSSEEGLLTPVMVARIHQRGLDVHLPAIDDIVRRMPEAVIHPSPQVTHTLLERYQRQIRGQG